MVNITKNKSRKVYYQVYDNADNINDFQVTIKKPNGQNHNPSPNMNNEGAGLYSFSYTPNISGLWIEKVKSNSHGDDFIQVIEIINYDLDDIQNQISNIKGNSKFLN